MLRNIVLLIMSVIGLALLRNLLREVGRFAARAMSGSSKAAKEPGGKTVRSGGRLVRDPQTGTYVDPQHAVRARVNGTLHYFESESSRDAFVRANT